jgi:hypothetical protein
MLNFQLIFLSVQSGNNMHYTDVFTFTQRVIHGGFINAEQQGCKEKQACYWSVFPFHSVNRSENYKKAVWDAGCEKRTGYTAGTGEVIDAGFGILPAVHSHKIRHKTGNVALQQCVVSQNNILLSAPCLVLLGCN